MTLPLDEKAVAAAHEAYAKTTGGMLDGQPMENAIRAYLSATPAPDGLTVVAWDKLRELIGEYFDLGYAEGAVQRDADTMAGDAQRTLSEIETVISQAQSALAAVMKERDEARTLVAEANNSLYGSQGYFHSLNGGPFDKWHLANGIEKLKDSCRASEAEVRRLTEANEQLKAARNEADNALVDKYRDPKTGHFTFPDDVAAIIRRLETAEARSKALEKALEFYAKPENYTGEFVPGGYTEHGTYAMAHHVNAVRKDAGEIARATLNSREKVE